MSSSPRAVSLSATPADHDAGLNSWNERTKNCTQCFRVGALRRLCQACRESMPKLGQSKKHQERALRALRAKNE